MSTQHIKVRSVCCYKGHSISANGSVNLSLTSDYSELTQSIKALQMLNNDIVVKVRIPDMRAMVLGTFRLKQLTVSGDGESTIKLNGISDYVEVNNLNLLPLRNDDNSRFAVMFETDVEIEGEEEE